LKRVLSVLLVSLFAFSFSALSAADVSQKEADKGSKIYQKKVKAKCGNATGAKAAGAYDMDEWEEFYAEGELLEELKGFCEEQDGNKADKIRLKDKHLEKLFHFLYFYGADSGKVPSCG
jgi:hypothetical protein